MCYMVDVVGRIARVDTDDLTNGRFKAARSGGPDEGLWCREELGEEDEYAEGRDLGVDQDGAFAEDGKEACGEGDQ